MNDQDNQNSSAVNSVPTQPQSTQPTLTWDQTNTMPAANPMMDSQSWPTTQTPSSTPTPDTNTSGSYSMPQSPVVSNPTQPTIDTSAPNNAINPQPNFADNTLPSTPAEPASVPTWPAPEAPISQSSWPQPTTTPAQPEIEPTFNMNSQPTPTIGTDLTNPSSPPPSNQNLIEALYAPSTPQSPTTPETPLPQAFSAPQPMSPTPTFQQTPIAPQPSPEMPTPNFGAMTPSTMEQNTGLQNPTIAQADSAPTDLSHLIGNTEAPPPADLYTPPSAPTTENLISATPAPTAVPESIDTTGHGKNNKMLVIIIGLVLLLAVAGASAYFILGIGRTTETTSVPVVQEQTPLTNTPVVTTPTPTPVATSSAGFGTLTPTASPSATKAPTAAELLKQRQSASPPPSTASPTSAVFGPNGQ